MAYNFYFFIFLQKQGGGRYVLYFIVSIGNKNQVTSPEVSLLQQSSVTNIDENEILISMILPFVYQIWWICDKDIIFNIYWQTLRQSWNPFQFNNHVCVCIWLY